MIELRVVNVRDMLDNHSMKVVVDPSVLNKHPDWPAVVKIISALNAEGYQALLAGGCVRDLILGRNPVDLDIATSALSDDVEKILASIGKTIPVGKSFGVIRIVVENSEVEVASFREDGVYENGRRPTSVIYSSREMDSRRRDFTMNAMYYDIGRAEVIDDVGGIQDIQNKIIRTVGDPSARFREDYLRILRAVRFQSQLDFSIDEQTHQAIDEIVQNENWLQPISGERRREEFEKLLKGNFVLRAFHTLIQSKIHQDLFHGFESQLHHVIKLLESLRSDDKTISWPLFWGAIFFRNQDVNWSQIENFRFSNSEMKVYKNLHRVLSHPQQWYGQRFGLFKQERVEEWASSAALIYKILACEEYATVAENYEKLFLINPRVPQPLVTGDDLKDHLKGKVLGECLAEIYCLQIENVLNSREEALAFAVKWSSKNV